MLGVAGHIGISVVNTLLEAAILVLLVRRISTSPLLSADFKRLRFKERIRLVPVASYVLWCTLLCTWLYFIVLNEIPWLESSVTRVSCRANYYAVVYGYGSLKFMLHFYIIERAHVIRGIPRSQNIMYWINNAIMFGCTSIVILPPIYENVQIRNSRCYLMLDRRITVPLVIVDMTVNLFWSFQFLYPIIRSSGWQMSRLTLRKEITATSSTKQRELQRVVYRTGYATIGSCIASGINVGQMIVCNDIQEAWLTNQTAALEILAACLMLHFASGRETQKLVCTRPPDREVSKERTSTVPTIEIFCSQKVEGEFSA